MILLNQCSLEMLHLNWTSSVYALAPMISPSADTMSYHLNATAANVAPVEFLYWCWQALLEMDPDDPSPSNEGEEETLDDVLKKGSNRDAWMKCKWREHNKMRRLVDLLFDIPSGLDIKDAPIFLIPTNKVDALYDEGVAMVKALQEQNANVTHIDGQGEHVFGFMADKAGNNKRLETWVKALWDE